jgi:hypothetical protein
MCNPLSNRGNIILITGDTDCCKDQHITRCVAIVLIIVSQYVVGYRTGKL